MYYPKSPFILNPEIKSHFIKNGEEELLQWLCLTPKITTYRVNVLQTTLQAFKQRVEKALAEIYPKCPPSVFTIPAVPEVLCIGALCNTSDYSRLNAPRKEVIVDGCCASALLRGAHIYAPGVLAMEKNTQLDEEVQVYADLEGRCRKGTGVLYKSDRKVLIGLGMVRMQRYQLYGENLPHSGIAIEMKSTISGVPSLGDLSCSEALLQNLPSIVCVRVLDPRPGERVLDMCAAPGNKTTHIAELMGGEGTLLALDKSKAKLKQLQKKISLYGMSNVHAFAYDATKAYAERTETATAVEPPYAAGTFDRILLDAPCSALCNRPLLVVKNMTAKMLSSYPCVQRQLFEAAVSLLRPGGVLVYSTCTVTASENEGMVAWALDKFAELELLEAIPRLGGAGLKGLGLSEKQRFFVQRFGPPEDGVGAQHFDTIGFFIAKFRTQLL